MFFEAEPALPGASAADGEFLVTFAGTHGIAQGLDTVLDAAALLEGEAHFAFVGDGPMKASLSRQRGVERGVTNVAFHPQVPLDGDHRRSSRRAMPCSSRSPRIRPSATSSRRS